MRAFIVVCLFVTVHADKLGYNYQPVPHSYSGLSVAPGGGDGSNAYSSYSSAGGSGAPNYGVSSGGDSSTGSVSAPAVSTPVAYEKEFYSFSANDDDFEQPSTSEQSSNLLNKNLRVIFIKGPEHSGLEDAAVALAKQTAEQKTVIYVLNKQADLSELANKLKHSGSNDNAKPEVHFVKYRTHEDAANAQRAIQSQYDSLGGNSKSYNGEVAPALNFASQAAVKQNDAPVAAPGASYLPASVFKRF